MSNPNLVVFQLDNILDKHYPHLTEQAHNASFGRAQERVRAFGWMILQERTERHSRVREGDRVIRSFMSVERTSWWATLKFRLRRCWREARGLRDFYHIVRWEWGGRWAK